LLSFVALLPAVISPLVLPAMFVGMWRSLVAPIDRGMGGSPMARAMENTGGPPVPRVFQSAHLRFCIFLTAALPLFVLVVHSLLYWRGKMASFGEPRYLLVVAPFWGVLSARGWEWIFDRMNWRHPLRWAGGAVFLPLGLNLLHPVVPVPLSHDWQSARAMARWYETDSASIPHKVVIAAHPGIFYFLGTNPHDSPDLGLGSLHSAASGTVLIWDPIFCETNASADFTLTLDEIRRAGWKEIPAPDPYEANADSVRAVVREANDPRSHWHVFANSP
jgi:hypothetical protein